MSIISNAVRNLNNDDFKVKEISRNDWISDFDVEGMRAEMRSRIASNDSYRSRSARAMQNITVR